MKQICLCKSTHTIQPCCLLDCSLQMKTNNLQPIRTTLANHISILSTRPFSVWSEESHSICLLSKHKQVPRGQTHLCAFLSGTWVTWHVWGYHGLLSQLLGMPQTHSCFVACPFLMMSRWVILWTCTFLNGLMIPIPSTCPLSAVCWWPILSTCLFSSTCSFCHEELVTHPVKITLVTKLQTAHPVNTSLSFGCDCCFWWLNTKHSFSPLDSTYETFSDKGKTHPVVEPHTTLQEKV